MSDHAHGSEHDPNQSPSEVPADTHIHVDRWEAIWLRVAGVMVVVFIAAIVIAATSFGITVPGQVGRIDPNTLNDPGNPFSQPGLRELAPGKYEAYVVAQTWNFLPDKLEVPQGAEVTFYLTARDVQHGFKLAGTNVNMMALPGQISSLKATFNTPGVYNYICHEYCGYVPGAPIGHQTMYGQLTVLPSGHVTTTAQIITN